MRLKFQTYSPVNQYLDWYLDNFRIYTCNPQMPGAPQDAYAYFDGPDLKIDWSRSGYLAGATGFADYHYELTYNPPIPGAPATFTGSGSGTRFTLTVPGAMPDERYTITLRVKMDTATGLAGPTVTLPVYPYPPVSCPSPLPQSMSLVPPFDGRRPAPTTPPIGQCYATPVPRR